MKDSISYCSGVLGYTSAKLKDEKYLLDDYQAREASLQEEIGGSEILRRLKMKREDLIKMRDEYKQRQVLKMAKNMEDKLDKCKIREKNLEGDCLLIALSVCYLAPFSFKERINFRKELAEKMLALGLEASEFWLSDSETTHCKLFKKIVSRDLGLKWVFNKLSHLFIDSNFAEFLICMSMAPSVPVIYDTVGCYQDYLVEEVMEEA